ncbi:MAG: DNA repair protein RecN [Eubacteriales bacterium]|nr:DNA repair protein RecN [Eubacteriales bacterium]
MLTQLNIQNVAIIDRTYVEFGKGFSALTGETAAGKSILIDSINMVIGERTSHDIIRHGQSKAVVEAEFIVDNPLVLSQIDEMGIEIEDGVLILRREITTEGKSTCRANGQLINATMLKNIGKWLINIHGQHDSQQLLNPLTHIDFLDRYCDNQLLLDSYKAEYTQNKSLKKALLQLASDEEEKNRQIDILSYQIQEIDDANLHIGEEEELDERRDYLSNLERIRTAVDSSYYQLYSSESSVHDCLARIKKSLEDVASYGKALEDVYKSIEDASIIIDDAVYSLRDLSELSEGGDDELEQVEARINLINNLKRKYGNSLEDILAFCEDARKQLDNIFHSDKRERELNGEIDESNKALEKLSNDLTLSRRKGGEELSKKIKAELADLEMPKAEFGVSITKCDYSSKGSDKIEFMIATNSGQPLMPLSKIASGGELSRIMLAVKSILADIDMVDTLIFDEIDTGISGRTAYKTAEKISAIASKKQIICITHLSQIACMADNHYVIKKTDDGEVASTDVKLLDFEGRKMELARIIGGMEITQQTLMAAEEMLRKV